MRKQDKIAPSYKVKMKKTFERVQGIDFGSMHSNDQVYFWSALKDHF